MIINTALYQNLKMILDSDQARFEILFVYHGLKHCCRIIINSKILQELEHTCIENGLFLEIQDFKIVSIKDNTKGDFSNRYKKVAMDEAYGKYIVYISKSLKNSRNAKQYEKRNDVLNFGKILSYPECCIEFYIEKFEEQSKKQLDFIIPVLNRLSQFPFVNNRCLRYFGTTILSHFICDFECKKSKDLGEAYLELIKKYDLSLGKKYERMLKSFILFTEYDGIFYSTDYSFDNKKNEIHYNNINGTQKNEMYDLLNTNDSIKCWSHDKFKIDGQIFNKGASLIMFK